MEILNPRLDTVEPSSKLADSLVYNILQYCLGL